VSAGVLFLFLQTVGGKPDQDVALPELGSPYPPSPPFFPSLSPFLWRKERPAYMRLPGQEAAHPVPFFFSFFFTQGSSLPVANPPFFFFFSFMSLGPGSDFHDVRLRCHGVLFFFFSLFSEGQGRRTGPNPLARPPCRGSPPPPPPPFFFFSLSAAYRGRPTAEGEVSPFFFFLFFLQGRIGRAPTFSFPLRRWERKSESDLLPPFPPLFPPGEHGARCFFFPFLSSFPPSLTPLGLQPAGGVIGFLFVPRPFFFFFFFGGGTEICRPFLRPPADPFPPFFFFFFRRAGFR